KFPAAQAAHIILVCRKTGFALSHGCRLFVSERVSNPSIRDQVVEIVTRKLGYDSAHAEELLNSLMQEEPWPYNGLMNGKSTAEEFLLEEYKGLLELNRAREERFDRLLTLFLSLAGAPWVLYGFIVKNAADFSLSAMPRLVAVVFFGAGAIGLFVAMMAIQTRFTVTMYARATNAIRGYFAALDTFVSPPE